jgi:hypothetical protein
MIPIAVTGFVMDMIWKIMSFCIARPAMSAMPAASNSTTSPPCATSVTTPATVLSSTYCFMRGGICATMA